MKSLQENLRAALSLMAESMARKDSTNRVHGIRPSRIQHQHTHTVEYRRKKLNSFIRDLDILQETENESVRTSLKRGLEKCYAERTQNPDKMAEWMLYVHELESRGLIDLLP